MDSYVKARRGYVQHLIHVLFFVGFFVAFIFIYQPFDAMDFYDGCGGLGYAFHFLMLGCIMLLTLILTRTVFYAIFVEKQMLWWHYALWCLAEIFVVSLFAALYAWLFQRQSITYMDALSYCFRQLALTLLFPYAFHILYLIIQDRDDRIEQLLSSPEEEAAPIKLKDEHGRLKMVISAAEILYLAARTNYVDVFYLEAGNVKQFSLRNSMRSIEKAVADHGIVRCHRSYFINPKHVKVLRKDKYGFVVAEFNIPDINPIPISKSYYEAIVELM